MIDPVTGQVMPNTMQDVAALPMSLNQGGFNPFLAGAPPAAQAMGAMKPAVMPQRPPATMPGLPGDVLAATSGMPAGGQMAAAPSPFGGRIPQGLLGALLALSQRNPQRFDQRMQSPLAQRFGITPEMVAGAQLPGHPGPHFGGGAEGNPIGVLSMNGGGQGFAPPMGRDAQFAAQSQIGMDSGKAKNQNVGSVPAY